MKKSFLLSLFLSVSFFSCTSEEPKMGAENNLSNDGDFAISFNVIVNTELQTRRIEPNTDSKDLWENLEHNEDWVGSTFMINIYYDGVLFEKAQTNLKGEGIKMPVINPNAGIMSDFYIENGRLTFTGKFDSSWDPSKIYIDFFTAPWRSKGENYISYLSDYIKIPSPDLYVNNNECFFYNRYQLSASNDWTSIKTSFLLTRQNSEIILLVKKDYADEISETVGWTSSLSLNVQEDVKYLGAKPSSISSLPISFAPYRYYYQEDKPVYQIVTEVGVQNRYSSGSPTSSGYYGKFLFKYKDEEYFMFPPHNVVASEKKSYPLVENVSEELDGTELRFLTAMVCNYYRIYWTTFPLPEGGIQANKRYLYIVKGNNPFLKNKDNRNNYTRSVNEVKVCDEYELIEQSMDEPLPFDFIEEE